MEPVTRIQSRTAVLLDENIDTDRIIPARFLTVTDRAGLGKLCFHDWRYQPDGTDNPDFPLNEVDINTSSILVAGRNFGCGSSREHAPWALLDYGIQAVLCNEIADIFCNNALKNGLLAIVLGDEQHQWLLDNPGVSLSIDVEAQRIELPDGSHFAFTLEPFARHCLLNGVDQLGFLSQHADAISAYEQQMEKSA
ncbi:3-isopropylmalate/(R)-2-methylmalate dehydratase small subunit [Crossiella equi]|uniref:3-isopropylmalate dehydratase small subunit n=1 Tax=Crossiella equi TaxID=130796 RepID=A0ABS5AA27_9PSEU|nr:3-isopropylmalate dehydratase small subunit [Crossiella equi]MBP2473147.1 3-isopropylmalate/(R)-2-methylmalate dehydratase small subunit [Crossiella equi]